MISVVIPVLNESATIASVVAFARKAPGVTDVIVVDDGSVDETRELAVAAGASVVTSTLLGKGASMEDGLWAARNEVVLYLDGDLAGLCDDLVARMTRPILERGADFVKAKFSRAGGRVTTLTAKPLLMTFFPELARLEQPLGGIVAARRSVLRNLRFETDYGVDVGLLIDASASGALVEEVDVGHIEHDSQSLEVLGDMAKQVVRVLLDRASRYGRLNPSQIHEVEEVERRSQAELAVALQRVGVAERLALFDMDGVLLKGRFVVSLAHRTNRVAALGEWLDRPGVAADERTRRIAESLEGVPRETFEQIARSIPLVPGAAECVVALRRAGYRVGVVTDSYFVASEIVRRRVFADFSVANLMRFRKGVATGEVTLAPAMAHPQGCPRHVTCKMNVLLHVTERMGVAPEQVVAVGDGENDVCLLSAAGLSFAFHPRSAAVADAADHVIWGELSEMVTLVAESMAPQRS